MKKKIVFIINPISGTKKKGIIPKLIQKELDLEQFEPEIVFTEYRFHGKELTEEFVKKGVRHIVAVGGDGTVNEIASGLINTDASLGIIPIGSGNGFARHLSIPMNIKKAIHLLNQSGVISVDYGLVNKQPFFCTCGTGFDAYVSMEFAMGKGRGLIRYIEKIFAGFFNYKSQKYILKGEGIDLQVKAFLLTCANASQWGNNAYIAPQASIQDGEMDISIVSNFPIVAIPTLALQLFTKTIHKDLFVTSLRSKEITLIREQPGPFHYDGEPYEEGTEINIRLIESGLKVLVKKRF